MRTCILIPVYNECLTIAPIVEALKSKGLDVVVIDDGSIDKSGFLAQEKGAHVISHRQKMGKGFSLKEGFEYVHRSGYDAAVAMDGDGQHALEDLDRFLKLAQQYPISIINGNRMKNPKSMPLIRYLTNRFMSFLISFACRQSIPDTQCGYRYISCHILTELKLKSNDFEIETEILMQASRKGFKIYSVPIQTIYQGEKSQINPLKDTMRFIAYFLREIFSGSHGK